MLPSIAERQHDRAFVIDTNVLVDFPDIIPNGSDTVPDSPTIDISGSLLIVPTAVVRELSGFKGELSGRGVAARKVLRHLRTIVEDQGLTLDEGYDLTRVIPIDGHDVSLSVLPVTKDFKAESCFTPSESDMDGQIILTTMYAKTELPADFPVLLLTNDNGLAVRAAPRGVPTARYGYRYPAPNIGRRNVTVSFDLYHHWDKNHAIPLALWQEHLPDQPVLMPNEFVVMEPVDWCEHIVRFSNIGRYDPRLNAIVPLQHLRDFPGDVKYPGLAMYAEALYTPDIKVIICEGPAGTGKTFMPAVFGYESSCVAGDYFGVTVIARVFDDGLGYLPGSPDEKMDPNIRPIKDALWEYFLQKGYAGDVGTKTPKKARKKQYITPDEEDNEMPAGKGPDNSPMKALDNKVDTAYRNWFRNVAITHVKGRSFSHQVIFVDETQDLSNREADTVLTRISHDSKMIFNGSLTQIHAKYLDEYNNGLSYVARTLAGDPEVARITLLPSENMRDSLVQRITERQEEARRNAQQP